MTEEKKHATLSPSASSRWLECAASVPLTMGVNTSSVYADEGTAAHELAQRTLLGSKDTNLEADTIMVETMNPRPDADMCLYVQEYVDFVLEEATKGRTFIEQAVNISSITEEPDAEGTIDALVIGDDFLHVIDFKYGQGNRVDAEENTQLALYAAGALLREDVPVDAIKSVKLSIFQPRMRNYQSWETTPQRLNAFVESVRKQAQRCWKAVEYFDKYKELHEKYFKPGASQCKWCAAKANCPALMQTTFETVSNDFVDVTQPLAPQLADIQNLKYIDDAELGAVGVLIPLIEGWCKEVMQRINQLALSGRHVDHFKVVYGRKGDRRWAAVEEAEEQLKKMRIKEKDMYTRKLITPPQAEKLSKTGVIGDRQWKTLSSMIVQDPAKHKVVLETEPGDPIDLNPAKDFEDVSHSAEGLF